MKPLPLLAMLTLLAADSAAEPLGRLFFTPEQRASADRQRAGLAAGSRQSLDGIVAAANGNATRWISGEAQHGNRSELGIPTKARDRATLTVDGGPAVQLRVGESLDTGTGETNDVVAPGSVRKSP